MADAAPSPRQGAAEDPVLRELLELLGELPPDALLCCRDLLLVLTRCGHEEFAEVRQMLTAVRQLPGTPPGAAAVLRGGADLVRALDRELLDQDRASG